MHDLPSHNNRKVMGLIEFKRLRRSQVRDIINNSIPRNKQGGLFWSREQYIAYALARPLPEGFDISDDELRTIRFRRHEGIANDNINHYAVAWILWSRGLVAVDGVSFYAGSVLPSALLQYVRDVAPWLPRPPNDKAVAA